MFKDYFKIVRQKFKIVYRFLVLMVIASVSSNAQKAVIANSDSIATNISNTYITRNWQVLSIGIVEDRKTRIYNYGGNEADNTIPNNQTLYEIGSITKTFTSLILAHAVLEKRVSLDDDIRKYIKGNYPNLQFDGKQIKLIHLVNLTSGLPNSLPETAETYRNVSEDSFAFAFLKIHNGYTKEKFLSDLHNVKLTGVPGQYPNHSNAAAQLLAYILENIYSDSYDNLLKKYIIHPLKMKHTFISVPPDKYQLLAKGHIENGMLMPYIPKTESVATGIKSSVADMTKYMQFQLEEKDSAVKLTHQVAWGDINDFSLGMNWFISKTPDGRLKIRDDGTTFGFTTYILMYPELHFGVVLMTNEYSSTSNNKLGDAAQKIYEQSYFTATERGSDGFGFSPAINKLLAELERDGFHNALQKYNELKENHPEFALTESEINRWGYFLLRKGETDKALEIFKLNVELYSDSWNVYDSYGEALLKNGHREEAIKMYQKSIELNPNNENGKKTMGELLKQ